MCVQFFSGLSAKLSFNNSELKDSSAKASMCDKKIAIAILGALVALGGIFMILAAFQVLPHGANAISQLGLGGQIASACLTTLGIGAILAAMIMRKCQKQAKSKKPTKSPKSKPKPIEKDKRKPLPSTLPSSTVHSEDPKGVKVKENKDAFYIEEDL